MTISHVLTGCVRIEAGWLKITGVVGPISAEATL